MFMTGSQDLKSLYWREKTPLHLKYPVRNDLELHRNCGLFFFFAQHHISKERQVPRRGRNCFFFSKAFHPSWSTKKRTAQQKKTKTFYNLTSFILNQMYRGFSPHSFCKLQLFLQQKQAKKPSGGDQSCQLRVEDSSPNLWTPAQRSPWGSHATSCASKARKLLSDHGRTMGIAYITFCLNVWNMLNVACVVFFSETRSSRKQKKSWRKTKKM